MKIVLLFYLLVCCGAAESITEMLVDLGENVTLPCEVDIRDVLWFLMKPSEPPLYIFRSFSSSILFPQYRNTTLKKIFSVKPNSNLFIHNISINELGVYYCIQPSPPAKISRGITLYTQNHPAALIPENQTSKSDFPRSQDEGTDLLPSLIVFVIMTVALLIAVTALAFAVRRYQGFLKPREQTPDPDESRQDNSEPEYAEINFNPNQSGAKTENLESEYAVVQLPNQRSPRDKFLKPREQTPDPDVKSRQDNGEPEYAQVKFNPNKRGAKTKNLESEYAVVQLPNQRSPRDKFLKPREQTPDPDVKSRQDNGEPEYAQVKFNPNKRGAKTKNLESEYAVVQLPNQ